MAPSTRSPAREVYGRQLDRTGFDSRAILRGAPPRRAHRCEARDLQPTWDQTRQACGRTGGGTAPGGRTSSTRQRPSSKRRKATLCAGQPSAKHDIRERGICAAAECSSSPNRRVYALHLLSSQCRLQPSLSGGERLSFRHSEPAASSSGWIRSEVHALLDRYGPEAVAVDVSEPSSATGGRCEVDSVVLEALAARGVPTNRLYAPRSDRATRRNGGPTWR